MDTFLWRYTHPRDGRVITKDHFTEAEALRIFPEPERVEGSQVVAESGGHVGGSVYLGAVQARRWEIALPFTIEQARDRTVYAG